MIAVTYPSKNGDGSTSSIGSLTVTNPMYQE